MTQSEVLAERLWEATRCGDVGEIQTLLAQEVNPNDKLYWNKQWCRMFKLPPLHTACKNGNLEVVKVLHEGGAKADIKDATGQTPLERALDNQYDSESYVDVAEYLVKHGYSSSKERDLLLLGACRWGKLDLVKELIEQHKVDPKGVKDHKGRSPLDRALHNLHTFGGRIDVGLYLLNIGCGNEDDKAKLLFGACQWGRLDVVKELVEKHKLDPSVLADEDGKTPEDIAKLVDYPEVVEYLSSLPKVSPQSGVARPAIPRISHLFRKMKTPDSETKKPYKEIKEDIKPTSNDTPLSKEDVDALDKLLQNTNIELASSSLTLEMVQQLLLGKGLENLATNLRAKLDEVIKQNRYLKRLDGLKSDIDSVHLLFLKIFLVGPNGVGKTSTLNRLLKNIPLTGDEIAQLTYCIRVLTSIDSDQAKWLLSDEASQLGFASSIASNEKGDEVSDESKKLPSRDTRQAPQLSVSESLHSVPIERQALAYQQNRLKIIKARLRKLVAAGDYPRIAKLLGNTLLSFIDVGSKSSFLEMLPALSTGPAIYLVFFNLSEELCMLPLGQRDTSLTDTVQTLEATISQNLAAISSVHIIPHEKTLLPKVTTYSETFDRFRNVSPRATLIATHKDRLENTEEIIKHINESLKPITEKFSSLLVSPSTSNTCFFPVDNHTGTEQSDISPLREFMNRIFRSHFKEASLPIPAKWLILGAVLSREFKVVTTDESFELGEQLEMSREEVLLCLQYLDSTGTVMHYTSVADDRNDWFNSHIICSPQVIFDSISQLIIAPLHAQSESNESDKAALFERGQFSLESLEKTEICVQNELIPITQLVKLLFHVNLLSQISHANKDGNEKISFLLPALLDCATSDELPSPPTPDDNNPEPLLITFSCGYVPTGTFCGLINRLVSLGPQEILGLTWELVEKNLKRNCVSFYVEHANKVTLISHNTCYEIRVKRKTPIPLHDVCTYVLSAILYTLRSLYANLIPQIAFHCPCPKHASHQDFINLCSLFESKSSIWFTCNRSPVLLTESQQVWLGKHVTLDSSVKLEVLKFAEGNFSFSWTKEGSKQTISELSDVTFQSVGEEDLGYYCCEVQERGGVVLTVYRALYKQTEPTDPDSDTDSTDRTKHLKALRKELWDIRAKWEDLGIDLEVSMGTIEAIETEHKGKVVRCFTALLYEWLQGDPQLGDLLEALRGPAVDRADLAEELSDKLKTGKLE